MEDDELGFSNPEILLGSGMVEEQSSSMDSLLSAGFLNDCLGDCRHHHHHQHACSHMHTCNPPGPDHSHTHTCFHVHTKIVPATADQSADSTDQTGNAKPATEVDASSKKSRKGNCEAVRKYRLKKKARAASLEEEVAQLREINQQLMKRLQGQAALEAEVALLRCLLVDIRGRIEGEIGTFPYQKPTRVGGDMMVGGMAPQLVNSCNFSCDEQLQCLQMGLQGRAVNSESKGQAFGACGIGNVQCSIGNMGSGMNLTNCGQRNMMPEGCTSSANNVNGPRGGKEG